MTTACNPTPIALDCEFCGHALCICEPEQPTKTDRHEMLADEENAL